MDFEPIKSSSMAAVGYDKENQVLGVQFHNGREYHYQGVHPLIHQELMTAESPGKYFQTSIRNIFETKPIAPKTA